MSKVVKAASFAAIFLTAGSAVLMSGAGSAFGADALDVPEAQQNEIMVDPALIAEQQAAAGNDEEQTAELVEDEESLAEAAAEIELPEPQRDAGSLSELVAMQPVPANLDRQMRCLAGTVYFESKGESLAGQLAVAEVVLGRAESPRWPNSICGVVYQRSQFSFVRGGRMPPINHSSRAWKRAVAIAQIAVDDAWDSPVEGALFFHARYVRPGWRLQRVGTIDNHIFYR